MHIEDMLWFFDRGFGFYAVYNKRETEYHLCTNSNFMRMRSNERIERTKLQTINISSVTFYYPTANMTPSLKSNCMKAL